MYKRRMVAFNVLRGFAAIVLALAVAAIFIFLASDEPFEALKQLLIAPLVNFRGETAAFNVQSLYQILALMIPTMFTGLGVCVMFSADMFNLGGEGAVMAGGFVGALIGIYWPMPAGVHPLVAVLIGALLGGLITLIPAILRVKVGASEMVSSLMLNYVVMYVIMHFLNNVFADRSKGATQTFPFLESVKIPSMVPGGSRLTYGFIVALLFVVIISIFMYRTRWGYQIRMIGINPNFAKYSGMNVMSTLLLAQFIGGFLAGMGGAIEVLGRYNTFLWKELPGYGWTGITIAILARNNPAFVPFAAFFLAYLDRGCQLMSTHSDIPAEMIAIIQASIFLFFAAEQFLSGTRQKLVVKNTRDELAELEAERVQEGK
ncbi:MAG: ABC transporter permease [Eubacteriales bacterium]|nr:ABC transporter permease [Eubacteriales bacterium]MDD4323204.1 ABC transporter permease [Eubacteriales bacterium]